MRRQKDTHKVYTQSIQSYNHIIIYVPSFMKMLTFMVRHNCLFLVTLNVWLFTKLFVSTSVIHSHLLFSCWLLLIFTEPFPITSYKLWLIRFYSLSALCGLFKARRMFFGDNQCLPAQFLLIHSWERINGFIFFKSVFGCNWIQQNHREISCAPLADISSAHPRLGPGIPKLSTI